MKSNWRWGVTLGVALAVTLPGCAKRTDANAELEKAADSLADAGPAVAPAPVPAQPAEPLPPAPAAAIAPEVSPAQRMTQAMVAFKAGSLKDAVTLLQELRAMRTMTPQQRIAVNDAIAAVTTDIYGLAAKGDSRAIQAVKQYELMQTHRH